jgi:hypothetical protein
MSETNIGQILIRSILRTHSHGLKTRTRHSAGNGINGPVGKTYEEGISMNGFVQDIEGLSFKNEEFPRVLYTAKHSQLVVIALKPKEEIGAEGHKLDQFFRVEEGSGEAVHDGVRTAIQADFRELSRPWNVRLLAVAGRGKFLDRFFDNFTGLAGTFLNTAKQLVVFTFNELKVVVRELRPFLF